MELGNVSLVDRRTLAKKLGLLEPQQTSFRVVVLLLQQDGAEIAKGTKMVNSGWIDSVQQPDNSLVKRQFQLNPESAAVGIRLSDHLTKQNDRTQTRRESLESSSLALQWRGEEQEENRQK